MWKRKETITCAGGQCDWALCKNTIHSIVQYVHSTVLFRPQHSGLSGKTVGRHQLEVQSLFIRRSPLASAGPCQPSECLFHSIIQLIGLSQLEQMSEPHAAAAAAADISSLVLQQLTLLKAVSAVMKPMEMTAMDFHRKIQASCPTDEVGITAHEVAREEAVRLMGAVVKLTAILDEMQATMQNLSGFVLPDPPDSALSERRPDSALSEGRPAPLRKLNNPDVIVLDARLDACRPVVIVYGSCWWRSPAFGLSPKPLIFNSHWTTSNSDFHLDRRLEAQGHLLMKDLASMIRMANQAETNLLQLPPVPESVPEDLRERLVKDWSDELKRMRGIQDQIHLALEPVAKLADLAKASSDVDNVGSIKNMAKRLRTV